MYARKYGIYRHDLFVFSFKNSTERKEKREKSNQENGQKGERENNFLSNEYSNTTLVS